MRRKSAVVTLAASSALALGAVSLTAEEARPLFSQSSATPVPAPVADTPSRDAAQVDAEQAKLRLREGTRLRDVIGHFASGVTMITARHDATNFGITASAVAHLRWTRRCCWFA